MIMYLFSSGHLSAYASSEIEFLNVAISDDDSLCTRWSGEISIVFLFLEDWSYSFTVGKEWEAELFRKLARRFRSSSQKLPKIYLVTTIVTA